MLTTLFGHRSKRYAQTTVWFRQIRIHQWLKNIFVLTPLPFVLSRPDALSDVVSLLVAFLAFCAAASSIYICNDLVDLNRDRNHPEKCRRPLAAGALSRRAAVRVCLSLTLVSVALALWVNAATLTLLLAYLALSHTYTLTLKRVPIVDLVTVGSLYGLRTAAGFCAASLFVEGWLGWTALAFLLALLVELGKRMSEAAAVPVGPSTRATLPYYRNTKRSDALFLLISLGLCLVSLVTLSTSTPVMMASVVLVGLGLVRFRRDIAALTEDVHPQQVILRDPILGALITVFVGAVTLAAGAHHTLLRWLR